MFSYYRTILRPCFTSINVSCKQLDTRIGIHTSQKCSIFNLFKRSPTQIAKSANRKKNAGRLSLLFIASCGCGYVIISHTEKAPITQRKRLMLGNKKKEIYMDEIAVKEYKKNKPLLPLDDALMKRAQVIMDKLYVANLELQNISSWEMNIIDDPQVSSSRHYANGALFFSKQLFDDMDDNEMAVIIGHEMAHVLCFHSFEADSLLNFAKYWLKQIDNRIQACVMTLVKRGGAGEQWDSVHAHVRHTFPHRNFGIELEADQIAFRFVTRACYDPRHAPVCMWKLAHRTNLNESNLDDLSQIVIGDEANDWNYTYKQYNEFPAWIRDSIDTRMNNTKRPPLNYLLRGKQFMELLSNSEWILWRNNKTCPPLELSDPRVTKLKEPWKFHGDFRNAIYKHGF